jgi:hypothetical protein
MMTLRDLPRTEELATQLEWFKTQLATIRTVHIAVVAPACILATWLPVNLKAPVVLSEELFMAVEAQLLRAIFALENELNQFDEQPTENWHEHKFNKLVQFPGPSPVLVSLV